MNYSKFFTLTDVKIVSKDEAIAKLSVDSKTCISKINSLVGWNF